MEQSMNDFAASPVARKKSDGGLKVVAAVASVAAIAGIGFGVFGMIQSNNKSSDNKEITIQVKNADGSISTVDANNVEVTDDNVAIVSTPTVMDDATRYIYVNNWGLKIKLDDEMEFATYTYNFDTDEAYSYMYVSGAPRTGQIVPEYADFEVCERGLGAVSRISTDRYELDKANYKEGDALVREPFMTRDGFAYFYSHPQAICSNDSDGEEKMASYIERMLSDPANYSAI